MVGILKNNALLDPKSLLANCCLILGGGILIFLASFWIYLQFQEQTNSPVNIVLSSQKINDPPTLITIPGKLENVSLRESIYQNNNWPIEPDKAVYLQGTADNSYSQNLIVYGHNKPGVFANLKQVKQGDQVVLTTQNGQEIIYLITDIRVVPSTDLSILSQQQKEKITIFTCIGLFDSQRLVVIGEKIT